jgi:hypothetical protein
MKTLSMTLLLIFAVYFGWQRYAEHKAAGKAAQDKATKEMWDGLHACEQPIYENYPNNLTPNHDKAVKIAQEALAGCRRFWIEGKP